MISIYLATILMVGQTPAGIKLRQPENAAYFVTIPENVPSIHGTTRRLIMDQDTRRVAWKRFDGIIMFMQSEQFLDLSIAVKKIMKVGANGFNRKFSYSSMLYNGYYKWK